MSRKSLLFIGLPVALAACAGRSPAPTPPITPSTPPGSDLVWVTGSSNIRSFNCRATQVAVSAEAALEDIDRTRADGVPAVKRGAVAIPVQSLDCGIRKMNHDLLTTLGGTAHPVISFSLWNYVVLDRNDPRSVRMNGVLRVAGRERVMVIHGKVLRDSTGQIRLRGERTIDVRDYGISPPTRFLGLLRVRKEVTVHFDVAVRPLIDPLGVLTSSLQ